MIVVTVLVVALANWGVVETLHHGSIFLRLRAYLEARGGFIGELFNCAFCLSHWTAIPLVLLAFIANMDPNILKAWHLGWVPVMWFAAVRLSNVLNDITAKFCLTPGRDSVDLAELDRIAGDHSLDHPGLGQEGEPPAPH